MRNLLYLNLVTNALEEITKSHLCRSVEIGSNDINASFVFPYLQFPPLFVPYDVKVADFTGLVKFEHFSKVCLCCHLL